MTSEAVVRSALILIANHYSQGDLSTAWISRQLGLTADALEQAFRDHRSTTCDRSILSFRLSRLFERITTHPESPLISQVRACGLASLESADQHFQASFGIALTAFHQLSLQASVDRQHRRQHPDRRDLIINE
jgi:transcriptional regulator GlxA family with amidase domain